MLHLHFVSELTPHSAPTTIYHFPYACTIATLDPANHLSNQSLLPRIFFISTHPNSPITSGPSCPFSSTTPLLIPLSSYTAHSYDTLWFAGHLSLLLSQAFASFQLQRYSHWPLLIILSLATIKSLLSIKPASLDLTLRT